MAPDIDTLTDMLFFIYSQRVPVITTAVGAYSFNAKGSSGRSPALLNLSTNSPFLCTARFDVLYNIPGVVPRFLRRLLVLCSLL